MTESLTLASRPQAPLKPRIWLAFVVGGSVVALEYAAGGLISLISSEPYRDSVRAVTALLAVLAVTVIFISRLAGSLTKGTLLFDSPPKSRRKLLRAMAFVAILVGIANLELARRAAELAPIETRLRQDLGAQLEVLLQSKQHLIEQGQSIQRMTQRLTDFNQHKQDRAALANYSTLLRQDRLELANRGAIVKQDQTEQQKLGAAVARDRAEQARLDERILPDEDAIVQGFENLQSGATALLTEPWQVLKSPICFQLVVSLLCIASALLLTLVVNSRVQIRENGLWQYGSLFHWSRFDSYRWLDEATVEFSGGSKRRTIAKFSIHPGQNVALAEFLEQRFTRFA
jgi:hypothetical protein